MLSTCICTSHQLPSAAECVPPGLSGKHVFTAVSQSVSWCSRFDTLQKVNQRHQRTHTLLSSSLPRKFRRQIFVSARVPVAEIKQTEMCGEKNGVEAGFFCYQSEVKVWIINDFSLDLVRQHQIDILRVCDLSSRWGWRSTGDQRSTASWRCAPSSTEQNRTGEFTNGTQWSDAGWGLLFRFGIKNKCVHL